MARRNPAFVRRYLAQWVHHLDDTLVWVALALLAFELAGGGDGPVTVTPQGEGRAVRSSTRARWTHSAAHNFTRRSSCALTATTTVLADMSTAPSAGVSTTPQANATPAARGMATTL